VVAQEGAEAPVALDVLSERLGLVLDQDVNREDPRVDEVVEHEVDDPVLGAKGDRRFGALGREGVEPGPPAAGQDHG